MRKAVSLALVLLLIVETTPVAAQALDVDVQKGIGQVDEGDYDGAILTLDNAARRLVADKAKTNDLAQAYLYLGIAYIGKGREAAAKAKFREAISQIKTLSLSADKFPPKVVDLFEAARAEEARATAAPSPASSGASPVAAPEKKKKGGGKTILIVGGLAAAGGIAAAAGGGGGTKPTTSAGSSDARTSLTFSGTVPNAQGAGQCYTIVPTRAGTLEATLTWTNGQIAFGLDCNDRTTFQECGGVQTRTSNTSASYVLSVTQKTYWICATNYDPRPDTFNLAVLFP